MSKSPLDIVSEQPLHGGDVSVVALARLRSGGQVVVKRGPLVAREARMLVALAEAGAPTPTLLSVADTEIVMSYLPSSQPNSAAWQRFGQDLAALHSVDYGPYGWDEGYAFGDVSIDNRPANRWPEFWSERRLVPHLGHVPQAMSIRLERLIKDLPQRLPANPIASLLHGDLWTGNAHFSGGRGFLIDPASYRGHNEVDLAMLTLFGTPPKAFWDGYGPLDPEAHARRAIYSLWPALVHVRLFGTSYLRLVDRLLQSTESVLK